MDYSVNYEFHLWPRNKFGPDSAFMFQNSKRTFNFEHNVKSSSNFRFQIFREIFFFFQRKLHFNAVTAKFLHYLIEVSLLNAFAIIISPFKNSVSISLNITYSDRS